MDGDLEALGHLVVGGHARQILRQEFILQSIIYKVVGWDTLVEERFHLIDHTLFQTGFQATGNLLATRLTIDVNADNQTLNRRQFPARCRVLQIVGLDLDGPDSTLTGIDIGRIMHVRTVLFLQFFQHLRQLAERLAFQAVTQLLILRHRREFIAFQHSLNIQAGSSTEDRYHSPMPDILIDVVEVLLVLEEIVFRAWFANVNQMIGNRLTTNQIIGQILTRSYIHPAIDLSGIR